MGGRYTSFDLLDSSSSATCLEGLQGGFSLDFAAEAGTALLLIDAYLPVDFQNFETSIPTQTCSISDDVDEIGNQPCRRET